MSTNWKKIPLLRNTAAACRDETGTATVEAVLWLPFFLAAFTLVVDGTMIFHNHSQILRTLQDANRGLSVGRYETETETESEVQARLASISGNVTVDTTVTAGVIETVVTIPASDLDVIGMFSGLASPTLTMSAQHFQE